MESRGQREIPLEMVRAATADAGSMLEDAIRPRMESCFGRDLRYVRLHRSQESLAANRALGSLAFAVDGHICLCPGVDARLGAAYTHIVAHELAHLMQKEAGKTDASPARPDLCGELEREADEVAERVLRGERVRSFMPDPTLLPRCWGPAGHYYTVFLASMMAGLSLDDCSKNAIYAQLPDLVSELDAIPAGKDAAFQRDKNIRKPDDRWTRKDDQVARDRNVLVGLHSFSGWAAKAETDYRLKILNDLDPGSFEFGLALHPLGDSFAHRIRNDGGARMFSGLVGQLPSWQAKDATLRHPMTGAEPVDHLDLRPPLYREYGLTLLELFMNKWPKYYMDDKAKQERKKRFAASLDAISSVQGEDNQINKMGQMNDPDSDPPMTMANLNSYYPEDDSIPWNKFILTTSSDRITPDLLDKAFKCAEDWSRNIPLTWW